MGRSHPRKDACGRVQLVWVLLWFNVLSFAPQPLVVPIPHIVGQVMTQGALVLALVLALTVNPRVWARPSLFLSIYSVLAITTLMMSIRFVSLGTDYRALRVVGFLVVLWLLTPWWGRRDLLLLRTQLNFLVGVLVTLVLGLLISPHKAYVVAAGARRLTGAIWPMPATQVGHYVAELTGLVVLLWVCRLWSYRRAVVVLVPSCFALLLSHTRTALLGMLVALLLAGLSLVTGSRRVRRLFAAGMLVTVTVVIPLSPLISSWAVRGESASEVSDLSGRTEVWPQVLSEPRPETNKNLGLRHGQRQRSRGVGPRLRRVADRRELGRHVPEPGLGRRRARRRRLPGAHYDRYAAAGAAPARAMAVFLIVYCLIASFTETGLGDASTYLLDLTLAASLLAAPRRTG